MIVGIPKEIKVHESRVAITPEGVSEFIHAGHTVLIQDSAGGGSAITNEDFMQAGATIVSTALAKGLNVHEGKIYYAAVAETHGYPSVEL